MAEREPLFLSVQSLQCPLTGLPTTEPPFQGLPLDRATNDHEKMLPVESCANRGLGSQGAPGPGLCGGDCGFCHPELSLLWFSPRNHRLCHWLEISLPAASSWVGVPLEPPYLLPPGGPDVLVSEEGSEGWLPSQGWDPPSRLGTQGDLCWHHSAPALTSAHVGQQPRPRPAPGRRTLRLHGLWLRSPPPREISEGASFWRPSSPNCVAIAQKMTSLLSHLEVHVPAATSCV